MQQSYNLCKCGCGQEVTKGRSFRQGHHSRVKRDIQQSEESGEPTIRRGIYEELATAESVMEEFPGIPDPEPELKVHIYPSFGDKDNGDGGIRRVVEAQIKHLPKFGIEVVGTAEEADIIICHITVPDTYLKLYPDKPIIAQNHGLYWSNHEWENWALKANAEAIEAIRVSDAVVTCSEWVANSLKRNTNRPVAVINHGIDEEDWPLAESLGYVLWNKTRPDPVCDPEPLNEVAKLLLEIPFVTTFGNDAPNVKVTGRLPFEDAKKIIACAGVYLCTARETFGIGTLEAMISGVPVVGYRWGGQAEFVEHGVEGWLATPGDINDLAKGIRWALENRAIVGAAARRKALTFTWESSIEKYALLFKQAYVKHKIPRPRTSIIVTNYNLHKYLPDCLSSVKNQTDHNWECIVVDDASTDQYGKEIVRQFAANDSRFRLVENTQNQYLAEARNIGIRQARGKYILPLDADDMLAPNAVALLANVLDVDKTIHITYGNVLFVQEDGKTLIDYGNPRVSIGHSGWPMNFNFEQQLIQRNFLPYCSMYRREAWQNVGGYRRRQRTAEDAEMWVRLASYGYRPKYATTEDTLIYRVREHSMSAQQGGDGWLKWYTWSRQLQLLPAGAVTREQLPVPDFAPVVISVVIPVGPGHQVYLQDAIDSIEAQTFQNWECIVVNDTGNKLPELPVWVRVVESEGSTGPAHARNLGIAAAKGFLFLPLDADDYLEPEALKFMYEAWIDSGRKDLIYSDFWQKNEEQITLHECDDYDPKLLTGKSRVVNGQTRIGMIHSVTVLTPKQYWLDVGGYDENLPAWEDWDFALAVADRGICSRRVNLPLFTYRMYTGFRREENYNMFDVSKQNFLAKWGKLWDGGKELMACRSCPSGRANYSPKTTPNPLTMRNPASDGVTLIEYTGARRGSTPYKGISGTTYWFGSGDRRYVLNSDVEMFMRFPDFGIITPEEPTVDITEPVLVAEGPPVTQPATFSLARPE